LAQFFKTHSYAKILSDFTFITFNRQDDIISIFQNSKHNEYSKAIKMIEIASFEYANSVSDKSGILFEGII
jgi:hypothetical protein